MAFMMSEPKFPGLVCEAISGKYFTKIFQAYLGYQVTNIDGATTLLQARLHYIHSGLSREVYRDQLRNFCRLHFASYSIH
jgi:hypothetical protein